MYLKLGSKSPHSSAGEEMLLLCGFNHYMNTLTENQCKDNNYQIRSIDLFSMLSYIATSRLVQSGRYMQKLLQLFNLPEILWFGRLHFVTKVLLNLDRF